MPEKRIILDGDNIATVSDFYHEVQSVLTNDFKHFGRNLDAFNDVFRGGFLVFEVNEPIVLALKNFKGLKKRMGESLYNKVIKIIKKHKHIEWIIE